jgi:hypothetical protein
MGGMKAIGSNIGHGAIEEMSSTYISPTPGRTMSKVRNDGRCINHFFGKKN